jgi:hypothetical protein
VKAVNHRPNGAPASPTSRYELTVSLSSGLRDRVLDAARRARVSPEQYAREALVGRVAFDRGAYDSFLVGTRRRRNDA